MNPDIVLRNIINIKKKLINLINTSKDENKVKDARDDLKAIEYLVDSLVSYTQAVFLDEEKNKNIRSFKDRCSTIEEYQHKFEELELSRKNKHDELIVNIQIADKICKYYDVNPIYGNLGKYENDVETLLNRKNRGIQDVTEKRHEIAKWTFDTVIACTVGLVMNMKNIDYDKDYEVFMQVTKQMREINMSFLVKKITQADDEDISL